MSAHLKQDKPDTANRLDRMKQGTIGQPIPRVEGLAKVTGTAPYAAEYPVENLKGKPAEFAVKVKEVKVPAKTAIDDEFAKSLGLESLEKLKELMQGQVEQEHNGLTRTYMKRKLLEPRFRRAADDGRSRIRPDLAAART